MNVDNGRLRRRSEDPLDPREFLVPDELNDEAQKLLSSRDSITVDLAGNSSLAGWVAVKRAELDRMRAASRKRRRKRKQAKAARARNR